MTDIVFNYVLPNVALFGGIYLFHKLFEQATWYVICNYDELTKQFRK